MRDARHLRGQRVLDRDDGEPFTEMSVTSALRRSAARAIQELAGHAHFTTTQRYMHLSPSTLDGAIRLLEPPAGVSDRGNSLATGSD